MMNAKNTQNKPIFNDLYVLIQNNVLTDKNLTMGEKIVYSLIFSIYEKSGSFYASNNYIKQALNISKRQAINYVNNLVNKNYIQISKIDNNKRYLTPIKHYETPIIELDQETINIIKAIKVKK